MYPGAPTAAQVGSGNHRPAVGPDPDPPSYPKPTGGPEVDLAPALARTIAHFWPDFRTWIREVDDTRDQDQITFSRSFLMVTGLMCFVLRLGARRQIHFAMPGQATLANLNALAGAHQDKLARIFHRYCDLGPCAQALHPVKSRC
ncbi:MAG: hypothetical protein ACP5O7_07675, partial [Phycisphaerae bacterium]